METAQAERQAFSDEVLSGTPERALKLLGYLGRTPAVFATLAPHGYTQAEHDEGWRLLHRASNYVPPATTPTTNPASAAALAELDAWDEPNLRRLRAAIARKHPGTVETLFAGIETGDGSEAILSVSTFLARVDALAGSVHAAALDTLESRGLTQAERARLGELVVLAKGFGQLPGPVAAGAGRTEHHEALIELKRWYDDWAETARTSIKRRDHLINLGLAARREPRKSAPTES